MTSVFGLMLAAMHRLAPALLAAALLATVAPGCGGPDRSPAAVAESLGAVWAVEIGTPEDDACVGGDTTFTCGVNWQFEDLHPHRRLRLRLDLSDNCWRAVSVDGNPDIRLKGCLA